MKGIETMNDKEYYFSLDLLRIGLVLLLALVYFGVPIIGWDWVAVSLNFAPGCLFAVYGFVALGKGTNYKARIKKLMTAFLITFVVYGILTLGYMKIVSNVTEVPYSDYLAQIFRKRSIFEFVVLNVWPTEIGSTIWMLQAAAYAMPILWFLDEKLHLLKYSFTLSILLFIINFAISDGAALWNFHFLNYTFIPGNFLTRALPYMLLGNAIRNHLEKLEDVEPLSLWVMFFSGIALCYCEVFGLRMLGKIVYAGHLVGHIMITFAVVALAVRKPLSEVKFTNFIHKVLYYLYNPVGEGIFLLLALKALKGA